MRALLALVSTLVLAGACWTGPVPESPQAAKQRGAERPSLYTRLGGIDALRAIVDEVLQGIVTDGRIDLYFMNADTLALRRHLADWLCVASGGPCRYTGKRLHAAHAGLGISAIDFDVFVDVLAKALHRRGVSGREKAELLRIVRHARADILEP
jgi:hemoglobin